MTPVMIIPILVLQSLNLHKSEIMAIAFLLCMGCLTIVATLLRYTYVTKRNAQGKTGNPNLITSVRPFCMTWRPGRPARREEEKEKEEVEVLTGNYTIQPSTNLVLRRSLYRVFCSVPSCWPCAPCPEAAAPPDTQ